MDSLCWKSCSAFEVTRECENTVFDVNVGNSSLGSYEWSLLFRLTVENNLIYYSQIEVETQLLIHKKWQVTCGFEYIYHAVPVLLLTKQRTRQSAIEDEDHNLSFEIWKHDTGKHNRKQFDKKAGPLGTDNTVHYSVNFVLRVLTPLIVLAPRLWNFFHAQLNWAWNFTWS